MPSVTSSGSPAGDTTTNDVIVWTRAKDEANPQPTAINVQISQGPNVHHGSYYLTGGNCWFAD